MTPLKAVVYMALALVILQGVYRVCSTLDGLAKAMHEDCLIGDGTPPKFLNDPQRPPFSFRK